MANEVHNNEEAVGYYLLERTHCRGKYHCTPRLLFAPGLESVVSEQRQITKKENGSLLVHSEAVETKLVKLETSLRYSDPSPNWECPLNSRKYQFLHETFVVQMSSSN